MAERGPDGSLSWFEGDPWSEESPWLQVWSLDGALIYRTAVARRLPVPGERGAARSRADGRIVSVASEPAPFRILGRRTVHRRRSGGRPGWPVRGAHAPGGGRAGARAAARDCRSASPRPGSAATIWRGAPWNPSPSMTERARAITASRLGERLPIDNPDDELGRLADGVQRDARPARFLVHSDAPIHRQRVPRAADAADGDSQRRRGRSARAARRRVVPRRGREHAGGGGQAERPRRSAPDRIARGQRRCRTRARDAIDLAELADNVANHLGVLAEEREQSLLVVVRDGRPTCRGDRIVLRQAVINLVDNAIKYTPAGGKIELRVSAANGQRGTGGQRHRPRRLGAPCALRLFDRLYRVAGSDATRAAKGTAGRRGREQVSGSPSPAGLSRPIAGGSATSGSRGGEAPSASRCRETSMVTAE